MKEAETIYRLLGKICALREGFTYKLTCCYSDGMGNSIFTICFYQNQERTIGKISFQGETGEVYKCYYKGGLYKTPTQIIDLLLDLYNYEKTHLDIA